MRYTRDSFLGYLRPGEGSRDFTLLFAPGSLSKISGAKIFSAIPEEVTRGENHDFTAYEWLKSL